jgi:xylulokinase
MAAMLNGASPIAWWSKSSGAEISTLLAEAEIANPENVPLFLPYLTGERTPHNDANIRGSFYGLGSDTGRAEMTQAVLDAIAYSFCDARDALAQAGTTITNPAVIGGGARSDHLLQTIADALGLPLKRYQDAETGPAFGAARLAMISSNCGAVESIATAPDVDRAFTPNSAAGKRHVTRLERYRALYQTLKPFAAT